MTERCQMKFTEKFENQNYVIYVGILVASLAVLYVYRFHFVTIAFSYGLGCVACYYGLNSNVLDSLVNKLKCHSALSDAEEAAVERGDASCATCGSSSCPRHDATAHEPWVGLRIHKQLDLAIENFYNAILEQYITPWHARLAARPHFVHELRAQLRRASAALLRRAVKVNYSRFLTERLLPCALRHYTLWAPAGADGGEGQGRRPPVHPAAANRTAELKYLRSLTRALMPYLLDSGERDNPVFAVLVREIFAGWVLLSLTDVLADPYILNALVILATGDETMAQLPREPDYRVEFLSEFARTSTPCDERARLLRVDLDVLLGEPPQLYAFMQHIKTTPHLALLQFYKDIKQFQTKLLNPSLSGSEQGALCREGAALLARHTHRRGLPHPHPHDDEQRDVRDDGADIKRWQTSPLLFEAAHEAHAALDTELLPRFLHSEEVSRCRCVSCGVRRWQTSPLLFEAAHEAHAALDTELLPRFLHSEEVSRCRCVSCGVRRWQTSPLLFEAAHEAHAALDTELLPRFLHSEEVSRCRCVSCGVRRWQTSPLLFEAAHEAHAALDTELLPRFLHSEEVSRCRCVSCGVRRWQTSPLLFEAAHEAHAALDTELLPRFLHSEEFYKILIGSRIPTGYQKQRKRQRRVRAPSAPRPDGPAPADAPDAPDAPAPDDDDGAILAYLDRLAADELADLLSTYKVSLTGVDTRPQAPPRGGTVRVFTLAVYCGGRLWDVERGEHDFHLLRGKLLEFHGERLLADLCLPSRRDNSPDETLRYKYEDFLQRVLQQPLLQGSALLRLFLSEARGEDFARDTAAAALGAGPDLGQLYQTVTHRLRKEKGQHLDAFLRNYLLSADMERYQALKQGAGAEQAREASEEPGQAARRPRRRDVRGHDVFGNNFDVQPDLDLADGTYRDEVVGFTRCLMYLLRKVLHARIVPLAVLGALAGAARRALDELVVRAGSRRLARAVCQRRLAHLVRLGHDVLFGSRASPRMPLPRQRELALSRLRRALPAAATLLLGAGLPRALEDAFRLLQHASLNKQLVYNLLDLCVMELFPELSATDNESNEPKS